MKTLAQKIIYVESQVERAAAAVKTAGLLHSEFIPSDSDPKEAYAKGLWEAYSYMLDYLKTQLASGENVPSGGPVSL